MFKKFYKYLKSERLKIVLDEKKFKEKEINVKDIYKYELFKMEKVEKVALE